MPVEDINAAKMLSEAMNVFKSGESISGFWANNSDFISIIIVFILILVTLIGVFVFGCYLVKKALKH